MRLSGRHAFLGQSSIAAVALAGCVSSEQIHAHYEPLRAQVKDEVKEVASHIKPEHFERCRQLLTVSDVLGTKYQPAGEFKLNLRMSCHAQGLGMGMELFSRDYKVAVYQIAKEKVSAGLHLADKITACEVRLYPSGEIKLSNAGLGTKGPSNSACHHV